MTTIINIIFAAVFFGLVYLLIDSFFKNRAHSRKIAKSREEFKRKTELPELRSRPKFVRPEAR